MARLRSLQLVDNAPLTLTKNLMKAAIEPPFSNQSKLQRFVLDWSGHLAHVDYEIRDHVYYLLHAEVPSALRGQGVGQVLVEKTYAYLHAHQLTCVPVCSYIQAIVKRNPELTQGKAMSIQLLGVQVAKPTGMMIDGKRVMTAIQKTAISGTVAANAIGLSGDEQASPDVHGGLDKAVYAYPSEHYAFWRKARQEQRASNADDALAFGSLGENLTLSGLLETDVWIGDRLLFPNCTLRVTDPREPCFKFNAVMGWSGAAKAMAQSGFCGFYLAVEEVGAIQAGEFATLIAGSRQMSIPESFARKMKKHISD